MGKEKIVNNNYILEIEEIKEKVFDAYVDTFKFRLNYNDDSKILICEYFEYSQDLNIIFAHNITLYNILDITEKLEVKSKNLRVKKLEGGEWYEKFKKI